MDCTLVGQRQSWWKKEQLELEIEGESKERLPIKSKEKKTLCLQISYLWKVGNVSSINAHLLCKREREKPKSQSCVCSFTTARFSVKKWAYLCYFEELWYPSHSGEKLLVNVQAFFTLGLLHVKVFLCWVKTLKWPDHDMDWRQREGSKWKLSYQAGWWFPRYKQQRAWWSLWRGAWRLHWWLH